MRHPGTHKHIYCRLRFPEATIPLLWLKGSFLSPVSMSCLCGHGSSLWLLLSSAPFPIFYWGGGADQTSPSFYTLPPPPPGSPVSSERPVDSGRGGVEGSWTLPVAWLATDVGVVCGGGRYNTIRIGLLRWQLALKKEEEEGGQGTLRDQ